MKQVAYTNARQNMVDLMEEVNDTHEPVEITRRGKRSVVVMSYEDYKAIEMTAQMLQNPDSLRDSLLGKVQTSTNGQANS
jgi:antitoxin YefM